jgi:transposase
MDMWVPYFNSTIANVPDAVRKIVFDRFHVMGHMLKAVDTVRKQEHRSLWSTGNEILKGTKYLWLYSEENLPDRHRPAFEALKGMELKVGRAWAIKESLRQLWNYVSPGWALRFFKKWYFWATSRRIQKPGTLQNSHILFLWRPRSLPTVNPDGPFFKSSK